MPIVRCATCGNDLDRSPSRLKRHPVSFCSVSCRNRSPEFIAKTHHWNAKLPSAEEVAALYESGMNQAEIGRKFGVTDCAVRAKLRRAGCVTRDQRAQLPPDEELIALYESGLTMSRLAERFGVSMDTISRVLRRGGAITKWHGNQPLSTDEVIAAFEAGATIEDLATKNRVSTDTIRRRLAARGLVPNLSGFGKHCLYRCEDGHVVRSRYEQSVDDWLYRHDLAHAYEPLLAFKPDSHADFLVRGRYIEIWGVEKHAQYAARKEAKIAAYRAAGANLIELYPDDIEQHLDRLLGSLLAA